MPWTEIRGPGGSALPTVRPASAIGPIMSEIPIILSATPATLTLQNKAKAIRVTVIPDTTMDVDDAYLVLCFDPPSDAIRALWLSITSPAPHVIIPIRADAMRELTFSSPISTIGYIVIGTLGGSPGKWHVEVVS